MRDRLSELFSRRREFMKALAEKGVSDAYGPTSLDLSDKRNQRLCRDLGLRAVEEIFEALSHFKNWKSHRQTEIPYIDRDELLEELIDAQNYLFSLMIHVGFNESDFYNAYVRKDDIIHDRLRSGY